jgi:hypothetical protein
VRQNWRKLKQLSPGERGLLLQSIFLLPAIRLALSIFGYPRTKRILEKTSAYRKKRGDSSAVDPRDTVSSTGKIVAIAGAHGLSRATCLHKALLVWGLLQKKGIDTEIRFGSRFDDGKFQAHAWVEYLGKPVFGGENSPTDFGAFTSDLPPREKTA